MAWIWPTIWLNPLYGFCSGFYLFQGVTESRKRAVAPTANPNRESRRRKGSISRYDPDAEASRPQLASSVRPGVKVEEVASADAPDVRSSEGEVATIACGGCALLINVPKCAAGFRCPECRAMNEPAAASGPTVAAGVPSDSEPWPAFEGLPKTGDRIACWDADDKCHYEGELRTCLGPPVDGRMNLTTDMEITRKRHEDRCWRLVAEGDEGSVGSPSPRAGQTEEVVSSATAMSEVDPIPALRFGGRSLVDRPAPATAAQADAALAGAAQAGAAVAGLREHYPISAVIVEFGRIVTLHRCPVTRYHIH